MTLLAVVQSGTGMRVQGSRCAPLCGKPRLALCGAAQPALWDALQPALCGALAAACNTYISRWKASCTGAQGSQRPAVAACSGEKHVPGDMSAMLLAQRLRPASTGPLGQAHNLSPSRF